MVCRGGRRVLAHLATLCKIDNVQKLLHAFQTVVAPAANAVSLRFDTLEARFSDPVMEPGNTGLQMIDDTFAPGLREMSWGDATDQSGYSFTSSATPLSVVAEEPYILGTFVHTNTVIPTGTFLDSAGLSLSGAITFVADDGTEGQTRAATKWKSRRSQRQTRSM